MNDGVIDAVVCPLKSGKEADIFVVEREPYHYVAKVYRERRVRSFKNDAGYREARGVRNTRTQRALAKGTRFGQELAEKGWHSAEVDALRRLEAAGARVPRVLAQHERVVLLELICDAQGQLAPQLAQVPLTPESARQLAEQVVEQVVILLLEDLIHGDLSPYNILIREDGPVLIDFPQCVSASQNQSARQLLERDVQAVMQFLGLKAPELRRWGNSAWQLWEEYERGTLTAEFRFDIEREREANVADLDGLTAYVEEARADAELEKRAAEGDTDAQALLRAAERRAAKQARRAAALLEAEAEAEREAASRDAKRRSRQRGKRRGGGTGQSGRAPRATDDPQGAGPQGDRDRKQGDRQLGDRHQGDRKQGDRKQGDRKQGDRKQGDRHQGDRQQGDRHQGDRQQGDRQQGDRHQGDRQQGDRHQGDRHQGDRHQGDRHQGDRHQGDRHQGDRQRQRGDRQRGDRQQGDRQQGDRQQGRQREDRPHEEGREGEGGRDRRRRRRGGGGDREGDRARPAAEAGVQDARPREPRPDGEGGERRGRRRGGGRRSGGGSGRQRPQGS
ncbi:MAG: RIO1 family regulatory kinase/ATPase [Planctomycetota bacterium]